MIKILRDLPAFSFVLGSNTCDQGNELAIAILTCTKDLFTFQMLYRDNAFRGLRQTNEEALLVKIVDVPWGDMVFFDLFLQLQQNEHQRGTPSNNERKK